MCLMCVEIVKSRMTFPEARKALPEMIDTAKSEEDKKHYEELAKASDEELQEIAERTVKD